MLSIDECKAGAVTSLSHVCSCPYFRRQAPRWCISLLLKMKRPERSGNPGLLHVGGMVRNMMCQLQFGYLSVVFLPVFL